MAQLTAPTDRLETFADGVFAIAATLLVMQIPVPAVGAGPAALAEQLVAEWPAWLAYVASFLTIGVIWVNHHRACMLLAAADAPLTSANLALLLLVGAIPFTNALVAEHLTAPGAPTAVAAYGVLLAAATVPWVVLWRHCLRHPALLVPGAESLASANVRRSVGGIGVYLAAALLGLVLPIVAMVAYGLLAIFFALTANPAPVAADEAVEPADPGAAAEGHRPRRHDPHNPSDHHDHHNHHDNNGESH